MIEGFHILCKHIAVILAVLAWGQGVVVRSGQRPRNQLTTKLSTSRHALEELRRPTTETTGWVKLQKITNCPVEIMEQNSNCIKQFIKLLGHCNFAVFSDKHLWNKLIEFCTKILRFIFNLKVGTGGGHMIYYINFDLTDRLAHTSVNSPNYLSRNCTFCIDIRLGSKHPLKERFSEIRTLRGFWEVKVWQKFVVYFLHKLAKITLSKSGL